MLARSLRLSPRLTTRFASRGFAYSARGMEKDANEMVSETMKAEGSPGKGSVAANMQSAVDKERNFEEVAQEIVGRMQTRPESITSENAAHLKSREARALGQGQPPADSVSADAQRLAAANEGAVKGNIDIKGKLNPETQSAIDRKVNYEDVAVNVGHKMKVDPQHVTKEEADMLHSREQRAFGQTEKGGPASQAQHLAAENEKRS